MPRKRNIIPSRHIHLMLPEDVAARLELFLVSEALGKVPFGAYQKFFTERVLEFFERQARHQTGKEVQ